MGLFDKFKKNSSKKDISSKNTKSFKYLDDLIHSGQNNIVMDCDISLNVGFLSKEKEQYENGIKLDVDNIIIDGNNHFIDALGKTRIFEVFGKKITLKNIQFKNGFAPKDGGAICNHDDGEIQIKNCSFTGNYARNGGEAIVNKGNMDIMESYFTGPNQYYMENKNYLSVKGLTFKNPNSLNIRNYGRISAEESLLENIDDSFYDSKIYTVLSKSNQTFRYLNDLIASGTKNIILDEDIHFSFFDEEIEIDTNELVIDGNGHTIDSQGKTRFFNIKNGKIVFKNIHFKNGFSSKKGGALFNNGDIQVISCLFTNNNALKGGAIYNEEGSKLNIVDSTFIDNIADEGGLAYNNFGEINCNNSILKNNSAYSYGGGIYINGGYVKFSNSDLSNNLAFEGGLFYNKGKLQIFNCNFNHNEAKNWIDMYSGRDESKGGAIYNCGQLQIKDSTLKCNESEFGGFLSCNGNTNLIRCSFVENRASRGGAISILENGELQINECSFHDNNALNGGAIYNEGELNVSSSLFERNNVESQGGAITNHNKLVIVDCSLRENSSKYMGGAIYNNGQLKIINNSLFGNIADHGSAIANFDNLNVNNCSFMNNAVVSDGEYFVYGGVIYNENEVQINNCSISDNITKNEAESVIVNRGFFRIIGGELTNNDCKDYLIFNENLLQIYDTILKENNSGNIILNKDESDLVISNCQFIKNVISASVICNDGKSCNVSKTTFESNILNNKAIFNIYNKSDLVLQNLKIHDSEKTIFNEGYIQIKKSSQNFEEDIIGNGLIETDLVPSEDKFDFTYLDKKIHEENIKEIVLKEDIRLENYESEFYEGGIELDVDDLVIDGNGKVIDGNNKSRIFIITGNNITLKNIIFKNGYSYKDYFDSINSNGGVLRVTSDKNVKIENCEFISNQSEYKCGVIFTSNNVVLKIDNCNFDSNKSGVLYTFNSEVHVDKCSFSKNSGNLIYNNQLLEVTECNLYENEGIAVECVGKSDISESNFFNNKCSYDLIRNVGKIRIYNSSFHDNVAKVLLLNKSDMHILESSLLDNDAGGIDNMGKLQITKSKLSNNKSSDGGAIRNNGELEVEYSVFSGNVAESEGGAIYNSGKLKIHNCELLNNMAYGLWGGGALFNRIADMKVNNCLFEDNRANNGGAILNYGENPLTAKGLTVINCTYKNNSPDNVFEKPR